MKEESPSPWLERLLRLLLSPRDRETVSGDLLEEYREARLPLLGRAGANAWYLRQLLSIAFVQVWKGQPVKPIFVLLCLFTTAASIWLVAMEHTLKRHGYIGRSAMDACILVQSICALLAVALAGLPAFRKTIAVGAALMALYGSSAILKMLRADHFEGFVLIIGSAMILEGALTLRLLEITKGA